MEWPAMILAHLTVVASTLLGWSDITVQPSRGDRAHASFQRSLAGLDRPSERTLETLKRYDLERRYRKRRRRRARAASRSIARASARPRPRLRPGRALVGRGRRLDRWRKAAAIDRFVDAVAYAYDFLFDPELADGRQPSDPRFRLACDLYNGGLERLIRAAQSNGPDHARRRRSSSRSTAASRSSASCSTRLALDGRRRRPDHPRLRLRGQRPADPELPVRPGRAADRRPQRRASRAREAGAVLPARDGLPADGVPRARTRGCATRTPTIDAAARVHARAGRPGAAPGRRRRRRRDRRRGRPDARRWPTCGRGPTSNRYRWTGLFRPGEALEPGQPDAAPSLRAGQDPRRDGPRPDLQPAGLDPDAQRAAPRPDDPAALPVPALHVPDRRADPDRGGGAPRLAARRPSRCTTPTAATRRSSRWSCSGTAWGGCSAT